MGYWDRTTISRRKMLRSMGAAGGGLIALSLIGCGSDSNGGGDATPGGGSGAGGVGVSGGKGSAQGYAIPGTGLTEVDPRTAGKPGGLLIQQGLHADELKLITGRAEYAGRLTHSTLVSYKMGYAGGSANGLDGSIKEPDVTVALPEIPDEQTYIFKLRQDVKFHNGTPLKADDVVYSFEANATAKESRNAAAFRPFYERAEAIDDYTVKLTTKIPYVDTLNILAWFYLVVNQAWEESSASETALMGTGAFKFKSVEPPAIIRFEKNKEYFDQPYPFFDEVHVLGPVDDAKKLADWASKQTHITYWVGEELRDQMAKARPDGICFCYFYPSPTLYMRVDQAPFNDKRVRQALMMSVDRDKFRAVATKGEGEDDQYFGWPLGVGFRKPAELGDKAKYWNYDPAEAKKLLDASGVELPIKSDMWHYDNTVVGQAYVDAAVFLQQTWREQGIADMTDQNATVSQSSQGWTGGKYDGTAYYLGDGGGFIYPYPFSTLQRSFEWPAEFPSANRSHIDDPTMRDIIAKAVSEFDNDVRFSYLQQLEDIMAEEQYVLSFSTRSDNFFIDPRVQNAVIPLINLGGTLPWMKRYWFDPMP